MTDSREDGARLRERCGMCGARALAASGRRDWLECGWCGAQHRLGAPPLPGLEAGSIEPQVPEGWHIDNYVARGWAAGCGLDFLPMDTSRDGPRGHSPEPARGHLEPLNATLDPRSGSIALAVIARADDPRLNDVVAHGAAHGFAPVVVVLDAERTADLANTPPGAHVLVHPLDGDFGRQRDRAQAAVEADGRASWVLHLDTDETLGSDFWARLPGLVRLAEREGLDAIGWPRVNEVDGAVSDLWPDTQYRLVRARERYDGKVHERPRATRDWRRTMTVLPGGRGPRDAWSIAHHLDAAHVAARTRTYDALGQDADRRADETALSRDYAP